MDNNTLAFLVNGNWNLLSSKITNKSDAGWGQQNVNPSDSANGNTETYNIVRNFKFEFSV